MSTRSPVLIVGAGPAGLVLALTLVQNGVPVRLIDKLTKFHSGQRGAGVMPRTMEVYEFLGVLPDALKAGAVAMKMRAHEVGGGLKVLKEIDMPCPPMLPTPSCPRLHAYMLGQCNAEHILRSHLANYGCKVELGSELKSFEQFDDRVVAHIVKTDADGRETEENVTADWLVGTDGGKGIVRKQLGLSFLGETREDQLVLGEVRIEGIDNEFWHSWGDFSTNTLALRPTERPDVSWMIAGGLQTDHDKIASDPNALAEYIHRVTGMPELKLVEIINLSHYRFNIRMVDKFGDGRVFVAGDAAHVHSPTGGQGMNSSVMDAFNLGWKLSLVCKNLSPSSLLSTYTEERLPVIAQMLKTTTALLNTVSTGGFKAMGDNQATNQPGVRTTSLFQLSVNYRWSSIVVDEYNGGSKESKGERGTLEGQDAVGLVDPHEHLRVRAGDRAPDAPGLVAFKGSPTSSPTMSLFQTFKATHHTILIFVPTVQDSEPTLKQIKQYPKGLVSSVVMPSTRAFRLPTDEPLACDADFVLKDSDGYAFAGYSVDRKEMKLVVVRPDGVVGAMVRNVEGLKGYFKKILSNA
ncbi:hypothetical protein JAAARDRAFT_207431 [Jaapia argillacea MUCL 33604]|uniref:Uncharacterized protein n=1 Tax=Jaapia argillacea MUCL 33604 TaxID=933084 RepID=A0A067PQQ4_9AGAM|nr:hypothetical protein JAAARDRAFT_207431 [Jaapia argillacea MUCL 33604]